ncbi:hypothetical protein P3X46_000912 [Hevea brasiliensis]|uniref:Uncharacterized protein n=1 Tax=Hevea brasiliensis TaxID=3981 RepID=A0ABQ9NBM4_HEVBR|nr:hypothetical protein P3X46_000912 [Hevea brasiliensis]
MPHVHLCLLLLRPHQPLLNSQRNINLFPVWTPTSTAPVHLRPKLLINSITCMAKPRRVKMVAKQIQRELSDMLLTDKMLQYAVLPVAALGADRYLSSLTTISDVEVSADLQVIAILARIKASKDNVLDEDDEFSESSDSPQDDRDWEGDDPDDIIYVK